jgi:hypothetical protein
MSTSVSSIPVAIRDRISAPAQPRVWTPEDFADLGPRTAVDQALHRLVASRSLRRIARGFYDIPQANRLTGKPTYPNPRDVIDALARKGKVRIVVDGLTAANDLGLTDAVPARIGVLTDGRLRPITLGNLTLDFQSAAPSRLYWAGRPAMRFVQALHWLRDMLPSDDGSLRKRLISILKDPDHGQAIQDDLRGGMSAMPEWMRIIVRDLLQQVSAGVPPSTLTPTKWCESGTILLAAPALGNHGALFARVIIAPLLKAQRPEFKHLGVFANDEPCRSQQRWKSEDGKPFENPRGKPSP